MRRCSTLLSGAIIGAGLTALALLTNERIVSIKEIDEDISRLKVLEDAADRESQKYSGGLILSQIKFQKEIYSSSVAMLEQKKNSIVHRITITYSQSGRPMTIGDGRNEAISAEIDRVKGEVATARDEADRYSGGLILSLALARKAQYELSLASLDQARIAAKYGIPLVTIEDLSSPAAVRDRPTPDPAKDKGAL